MGSAESNNASWKSRNLTSFNNTGIVLEALGHRLTISGNSYAPDAVFTAAVRDFQTGYNNDVARHLDWYPRHLTVDGEMGTNTFSAIRNYYPFARSKGYSIISTDGGGDGGGGGGGGHGSAGTNGGGGGTENTGGGGGGGHGSAGTNGGGGGNGNTGGGMVNTNNQQSQPSFIEQLFPPDNSIVQSLGGPTSTAVVTVAFAAVVAVYVGKQMAKNSHPARTTIIPPPPTTTAVARAANPRRAKKGRR